MKIRQKIALFFGIIFLVLFCTCGLGGCTMLLRSGNRGNTRKTDNEWAEERGEELLEALNNADSDALKEMFATNAIAEMDDFESSANALFEYYNSQSILSCDIWGPNVEDYGTKTKTLETTYEVKTSVGEFRIYVKDNVIETKNKKNQGIWCLYIIKNEFAVDLRMRYWGDSKDTAGIHVGLDDGITHVVNYLKSIFQDRESDWIKSRFAKNAIAQTEDFDRKAKEFFDYCQGEFVSMNGYSRPMPGYEDNVVSYHRGQYNEDIPFYTYITYVTDKGVYRIVTLDMETVTANNNKDHGIWSLYVIKAEEGDDLSVPYVGDGQYTTGIHIGIKSAA